MSSEIKNMISEFTRSSNDFLKNYYNSLEVLYWELDLLYKHLNLYSVKSLSNKKTRDRKEEMRDIRRRIADIYEYIRFYKECINTEKFEKQRLRDEYGYFRDEKKYREPNDDYIISDTESCNSEDYRLNENNLEEVKEYKYNFVTDRYE